jgi:hypothetical protein
MVADTQKMPKKSVEEKIGQKFCTETIFFQNRKIDLNVSFDKKLKLWFMQECNNNLDLATAQFY